MQTEQIGANLVITGLRPFSLADTLDCGQAFRWSKNADDSWQAVVGHRLLRVAEKQGTFYIFDCTEKEFNEVWAAYFDIARDYEAICAEISINPILKKIATACGGIRLLRQEPWETLCSFIISQNNNIPRIKGIIERLCRTFGEKIPGGYTFPDAQVLAKQSLESLLPLRSGFRAKYILDAAQKVTNGVIPLAEIGGMDTASGRDELMKINGVGPKVADCVLLFAYGKIDAFPQDVWIKRTMQTLFNGVLPEVALPYAGIVQQYLYHYARTYGEWK